MVVGEAISIVAVLPSLVVWGKVVEAACLGPLTTDRMAGALFVWGGKERGLVVCRRGLSEGICLTWARPLSEGWPRACLLAIARRAGAARKRRRRREGSDYVDVGLCAA